MYGRLLVIQISAFFLDTATESDIAVPESHEQSDWLCTTSTVENGQLQQPSHILPVVEIKQDGTITILY